jgi:hypothetical protein
MCFGKVMVLALANKTGGSEYLSLVYYENNQLTRRDKCS